MSEPKGRFTVRLNSKLGLSRAYRVYLDNAAAYFIKIGGHTGFARAIGAQFGAAGRAMAENYERKEAAKRAELAARFDQEHPPVLLTRDKDNFSLPYVGVQSVVVAPSSFWGAFLGGDGPHVGRLMLKKRDGKDLRLVFENLTEMKAAVESLPRLLPGRVDLKVRWDDRKQEYVKAG